MAFPFSTMINDTDHSRDIAFEMSCCINSTEVTYNTYALDPTVPELIAVLCVFSAFIATLYSVVTIDLGLSRYKRWLLPSGTNLSLVQFANYCHVDLLLVVIAVVVRCYEVVHYCINRQNWFTQMSCRTNTAFMRGIFTSILFNILLLTAYQYHGFGRYIKPGWTYLVKFLLCLAFAIASGVFDDFHLVDRTEEIWGNLTCGVGVAVCRSKSDELDLPMWPFFTVLALLVPALLAALSSIIVAIGRWISQFVKAIKKRQTRFYLSTAAEPTNSNSVEDIPWAYSPGAMLATSFLHIFTIATIPVLLFLEVNRHSPSGAIPIFFDVSFFWVQFGALTVCLLGAILGPSLALWWSIHWDGIRKAVPYALFMLPDWTMAHNLFDPSEPSPELVEWRRHRNREQVKSPATTTTAGTSLLATVSSTAPAAPAALTTAGTSGTLRQRVQPKDLV